MPQRKSGPGFGDLALDRRRVLLGLAAVGGFLALDFGAVLYARGWVGRGSRLTQQVFINGFRWVNGAQLGFRKNHAKGIAVAGYFDSNGNGQEISKASVFRPGRTPVQGRFSLAGGDHAQPDKAPTARGLGLLFELSNGEQWRTAMLNLPVFPDNSPQGFYDRLMASKISPDTGKPDPRATARFLAAHPETVRAMAVINAQPAASGFSDSTFRGLKAFWFVNESGVRTAVRWSLSPRRQTAPLTSASRGPNWLFDDTVSRIRSGPLQWRLLLTMGAPSDPVNDATIPWPPDRRVIDAGTLTLTFVATEAPGNARDINFDPLVLPEGIEPSDDPLLSPRSAVYAASYRLRAREPKSPPAVTIDGVSS
jgi:catalase